MLIISTKNKGVHKDLVFVLMQVNRKELKSLEFTYFTDLKKSRVFEIYLSYTFTLMISSQTQNKNIILENYAYKYCGTSNESA